MGIDMNKFNKWCEESGLDIELGTQQWSQQSITEGSIKIKGYFEDIAKCVNILIDNWGRKPQTKNTNPKKKNIAHKGKK